MLNNHKHEGFRSRAYSQPLRLRANLYAGFERYPRLSVLLAAAARGFNQEHQSTMDAALARIAPAAAMADHLELTTAVLMPQAWAASDRHGATP